MITFRLPDITPICERIRILNNLSQQGTSYSPLQEIAQRIRRASGWSNQMLTVTLALQAVQSLKYVPNPEGEEWIQDVPYTMAYGGECKALSVMLVALLSLLGVYAEVVWITQTGRPINHVTVVAWIGGKQYWAEPAVRGAKLGESPYAAVVRLGSQQHVVGG